MNSAFNSIDASYRTPDANAKRISLNLSDLNTSASAPTAAAAPVHGSGTRVAEYKRELSKLLTKSKGTAYENTLKKFVQAKYKEILRDETERSQSAHSTAPRVNLASLSFSRYDSIAKSPPTSSSIFQNELKRMKQIDSLERLEKLSKPLEKNIYKVLP